MVIVDTCIWISHLKMGEPHLQELLLEGKVLMHPFVIGELACGGIKNRKEVLSLLSELPSAKIIDHAEYLFFVEQNKLPGIGLGFVDIHLLSSARLESAFLWTCDKLLFEAAKKLHVNYKHN